MKLTFALLFCIVVAFHKVTVESDDSYYPSFSERITKLKETFGQQFLIGQDPMNFDDPDCNRTSLELITSKGYPGELHNITTKDSYILGVQRISAGQGQIPDGTRKPVVILQHGLEGCSSNYLINMANQSLGYVLADAGYDVWLPNSRGNTYSTKHATLNPKTDAAYWQFSWDHMAKYDLPAVVDYILQETGNSQVYYVGHSQGTMIGFAQFSSDLNFAKKIKAFFALAPVAKVGNISAGIRKLAPYTEDLQAFFALVGYYDFTPFDGFKHKLEYEACNDQNPKEKLCQHMFLRYSGSSTSKYNQTRIPAIMSHCPAGTSVQNMAHYGQAVNSDQFQKFNYNFAKDGIRNIFHYGQDTPPLYDPSKLNVPTIVFHSDDDKLADPTDVAWLLSQINNTVVENYHYTDYTHTDFIFAVNAVNDVYSHILDYIRKAEIN